MARTSLTCARYRFYGRILEPCIRSKLASPAPLPNAVQQREWSGSGERNYSAGSALIEPLPGSRTRIEARKSERLPSTSNLQ